MPHFTLENLDKYHNEKKGTLNMNMKSYLQRQTLTIGVAHEVQIQCQLLTGKIGTQSQQAYLHVLSTRLYFHPNSKPTF